MKGKTILLISPESWGANFVSKHHYANYLAKNNAVYFLNPVKKSKINPFGKIDLNYKKISESLNVVNYNNLLPKLNKFPFFIQKWIYKIQANQIKKKLNVKFDLVWSFDPNRFFNQKVWNVKYTIGHVVDSFKSNSLQFFYASSDINIVVSPFLKESNYQNMFVIGHGFDLDSINYDEIELPGSNKLKAIYLGNIFGLLDFDRLKNLAKNHSEVDFILIGPNQKSNLSDQKGENSEIQSFDNIFLIGEIEPKNIHSYLRKADVNLLMIKERKNILNLNSHKLMSYFYSGKVTVTDALLDYSSFDDEFIIQCQNSLFFSQRFKQVIENVEKYNCKELMQKRVNFALKNSYNEKILEISNLLYK